MNQLTIASHNHKMQLWTSRIHKCRSSNQTVADWCSENDISIKSYYYWMRKIKSEAFEALPAERKSKVLTQKRDASFAEVTLIEKPRADSCAVRIHVSGLLLEIQNGADDQTVEHTLHAIRKLC
ncbi:IS66 family insertion sequence element accessory protein TnpA [Faecalicatena contorta]|nr:hypothetical protein [Faecalicatena contorta]